MKIIQILRLIRLPNLLMMAFTMVLMRYCIVQPFALSIKTSLAFPLSHFILLVFSVGLIAAAGYIINDYFDVQTDQINRPDSVVIGKYISAKSAYNVYIILNTIALGITLYLSIYLKMVKLFAIFPLTMGILWFYSTTYKKQLLVGNILIAAITAGVPFLVPLFEIPPIYHHYSTIFINYKLTLNVVFVWTAMFSFFAFMVNLIRELVKDLEDITGDQETGRTTLPIAFGTKITRVVIAGLILFSIATLSHFFYRYLKTNCSGKFDIITFLYFLLLIFLPLIIVAVLIFKAKGQRQYTIVSTLLKVLMLVGVLYAIIVKFNIDNCLLNA
jgi:4-hydroxybenzoate polyprenyltransferase